MTTTNTRDASLRWVEQRLALMLPQEDRSELAGRAEVFVVIAEQWGVPIEVLIEWIDRTMPDKEWSAVEWRRFCELYRTMVPAASRKPPASETGGGA